jgi:hypothetical protein
MIEVRIMHPAAGSDLCIKVLPAARFARIISLITPQYASICE